jgi:hypothetical protein
MFSTIGSIPKLNFADQFSPEGTIVVSAQQAGFNFFEPSSSYCYAKSTPIVDKYNYRN